MERHVFHFTLFLTFSYHFPFSTIMALISILSRDVYVDHNHC